MTAIPDTIYFRVIEQEHPDTGPGKNLPEGWGLEVLFSRRERQIFYDTFESQAYHNGLLIVRSKAHLEIISLDSGKVIAETPFPGTPASFFAETLQEGTARDMLLECSGGGIRAFIRVSSVEIMRTSWKILDGNRKTVGTLTTEELLHPDRPDQPAFAKFHTITPLKGYHRELASMLQALPEPVDTYRLTGYRERFLLLVASTGHEIGTYSAKIRMQLDPDASIHENIRRLLRFTTAVMQANEPGLRRDVDTEFLHDYRVALRRARSIIRQFKGVFEPHRTAWALHELREIAQRTNTIRDDDVCLLSRERYLGMLPPEFRPGAEKLFDELAAERKQLHRRFTSYLAGSEYRNFMQEWLTFIADERLPEETTAPDAALSTREVSARSIRKAWKRIIVHGRRIGAEATDRELHELRIDAKRLRYLLEFFFSLFPGKLASRLISHLKQLQDNLGEFVDLSVQIAFLLERLESAPTTTIDTGLAAAVGGLATGLWRERERARKRFTETFTRFDDEQIRSLLDELLDSLRQH